MDASRILHASDALLPGGWARDVILQWDACGRYTRVEPGATPPPHAPRASGPVIPGLVNLHSHAFQRAFAGLTEYRAAEADSFWSWRTLMYGFAAVLRPEQVEAVAGLLYREMLEAGYTHVCEFHYLHHAEDGRPYADDTEMAQAVLRAAASAGMGITLLPVLYHASGFGGAPLNAGQRRFGHDLDSMQHLLQHLQPQCAAQDARLGLAPHSLRAVPPAQLAGALQLLDDIDATAPVHIHIAEQVREVEDCLAHTGQRPVAWLLDHAPVDRRWCLVHATHMTPDEARRAAATGAVAGLCPSTEANLGDGIFDMAAWREGGGAWGVGSDSHACVNAAEELALLEYSQRWATRARNVLATPAQPHVADAMLQAAVAGGTQAAGLPAGGLQAGARADFVVLDPQHVALAGLPPSDMLSGHVFASHRTSAIAEVWQAGRRRVQAGRAEGMEAARQAFVAARQALLARVRA